MSATGSVGRVELGADSSRWVALIVLCVGMLMIILDQTIVNVALPSIKADLGFSQASLAWVVNAYLIPFGGLLLLAGRLGDLLSRKGVFVAGLAVFVVASLLCGLAQSQEVLIGARFLQGIGGALTSAVILGMIVTLFPEPREQAKAIGVYSFVASAGASIGLLAGGALTEAINWHWIFFVNLPIGVATAALAMRLITADRGIGFGHGADVVGAVLITGSLMLGVYTIVEAADYGWGSAHTLWFGTAAIALLAAFVVREARISNPLIPLRIFRSRDVTAANLIQALMIAGMFGMFFLGSLYLERVLGYGPLEIGLAFLPVALLIGTLSLGLSARLIVRFGAKATLIPGLVSIAAGLALFTRVPVDASYLRDLLPVMILTGIGAGLSFPALMTLAMSSATEGDSGLASGLVNTSLQVGGALGLAVLATVSATRTENLRAGGEPTTSALTSGYHVAWTIGAGLVLAAIAIAVAILRSQAVAAPEAGADEEPGRSDRHVQAEEVDHAPVRPSRASERRRRGHEMTAYVVDDELGDSARRTDGRLAERPDAGRHAGAAESIRGQRHAYAAEPIAIRLATDADRGVLERLAALDSAPAPSGEVLIAEVGDEPQAAIELASGATIADPLRPTTHLVELLRLRATLLREGARCPRRLRLRSRSPCRPA